MGLTVVKGAELARSHIPTGSYASDIATVETGSPSGTAAIDCCIIARTESTDCWLVSYRSSPMARYGVPSAGCTQTRLNERIAGVWWALCVSSA